MKSPASMISDLSKSTEKSRGPKECVGAYAVQCGKCFKWREIPTKEEFETIRHSFIENPYYCDKKPGVSCEDLADLEYDNTRLWVIDKPNIPKPPPNTERLLTIRRDFSKMDAQYVMPNGKRVRSCVDVEKFLDAYPEYKDAISVSSFSFSVPKIMEDDVSRNSVGKASGNGKKMKLTREDD